MWAYYRERIDVDDLKAYNKFHAQKVLSYFFDETGENEKKGLLINPKTRKLILKIKKFSFQKYENVIMRIIKMI